MVVKVLIAKLCSKIELHLLRRDMKWEDALRALLEAIGSIEDIMAAIENPEGFLERAMAVENK